MEFITRRTHPPSALHADLETMGADVLVVGHTHEPMWYRCDRGLVVNPGSTVSMSLYAGRGATVQTSRTFALVDLAALSATFHDVESGEPIDVPPW
jgi:putative phosphoesterase